MTGWIATMLHALVLLAVLYQLDAAPAEVDYGQPESQYLMPEGQEMSPPAINPLLLRRLLQSIAINWAKHREVSKRTCLFNGGMSRGCDFKEFRNAADEANYFGSLHTPGRRRRRSAV